VRYDLQAAQKSTNELHQSELTILQNLFPPSMKLIKKTRVGAKHFVFHPAGFQAGFSLVIYDKKYSFGFSAFEIMLRSKVSLC